MSKPAKQPRPTTAVYRTPATVSDSAPPRKPSALAVFFAWLLPVWLCGSLAWYRRARRGRWSRVWVAMGGRWHLVGWRPQPACVDGTSAQRGECTSVRCRCEEHP